MAVVGFADLAEGQHDAALAWADRAIATDSRCPIGWLAKVMASAPAPRPGRTTVLPTVVRDRAPAHARARAQLRHEYTPAFRSLGCKRNVWSRGLSCSRRIPLGKISVPGLRQLRRRARLRKALSASWGRPLTYANFVLELCSPATCCASLLISSQPTVLGMSVDCCSATCFCSESTLQIRGIVDLLRRHE